MPLPGTEDDFWQMVAESGAETLVTLGPLEDEVGQEGPPATAQSTLIRTVAFDHVLKVFRPIQSKNGKCAPISSRFDGEINYYGTSRFWFGRDIYQRKEDAVKKAA